MSLLAFCMSMLLAFAQGGGDGFAESSPTFYCTAKTGSQGCVPFLTTSPGAPSVADAAAGISWSVFGNNHLGSEGGFLLYAFKKSNLNYHGGKLCIKSPITRTPAAKGKISSCANCSGSASCTILRRNFNLTIASGADPLLTTGQTVFAQFRQRDPLDPLGFGDNLTNGVRFVIQ